MILWPSHHYLLFMPFRPFLPMSDAPPVNSPRELCGRYTLNGTIAFGRDYYDDRRWAYRPLGQIHEGYDTFQTAA